MLKRIYDCNHILSIEYFGFVIIFLQKGRISRKDAKEQRKAESENHKKSFRAKTLRTQREGRRRNERAELFEADGDVVYGVGG
jgi:hypothetical protein